MKQTLKFLDGNKFSNKAIEEWGNDWKFRLTPASNSKVLREWRRTGKRPKPETAEEYTKRRIREATAPTTTDKILNKTADVLHGIGVGASTAALIGSAILNPVGTAGAIIGGTVGGRAADKAVLKYTGNNQTTWAREFNRKLGLRENSIIGELFNPGMLLGGGIGSKGASLTKQGVNYLIQMDMPRYGYAPTTQYFFKPGTAGMDAVPVASSKVIFKSPKLTITLATVDDFWKRVGNLTEKEMVELGYIRPYPGTNLHIVIMDGKPTGSYERIYHPYRPKVEIVEVAEKPVEPLLKGKARKALLEKIWTNAEKELEPMKSQHPIPSKTTKFEDVTNATLEELINNLFTQEGRIELPLTWQELERNPELMKFVEELGKRGVPILEETGEPIIGKIDQNGNIVPTDRLASLLAYRTGNNSQIGAKSLLMNDTPFIEGLRGTLPLLERVTLLPNGQLIEGGTKAFGNLNFSSDNLLGALNYADVLNHDLLLYVINALRARGYNIPEQSVDYVAELINNIRTRQMPKTNPKQKGFKLGGHREEFRTGLKFPRSQHGETDGVGDTDAKRLGGIWRSVDNPQEADWVDYINDMVRYNRFFGPEQGHGGIQTIVSRRPRFSWEEPADLLGRRFSEPVLYKGKLYDDIHTLEQYLGNNGGFYGLDVINGRNPLLMRTLIAPRGSYFYGWGLKKGGKLLKKSKIISK